VPQVLRALILLLGAASVLLLLDALPIGSDVQQFAIGTLLLLAALVFVAMFFWEP
jgi:hypothetical protein